MILQLLSPYWLQYPGSLQRPTEIPKSIDVSIAVQAPATECVEKAMVSIR